VPFKQLLTDLVHAVPGAHGAILADWEGEAVEQFSHGDSYEMKVTAAHWGILHNRFKDLREHYPIGDLKHGVITTSEQHVLVGAIGDDYTLVMTMNREALPFEALPHFKATAGLLMKEIY
jgi:predicted regulator of Ras-like GTPase activity (Roadblock/LC7/MglB family)